MIRNGFIRCEGGNWISLVDLRYFEIEAEEEDYVIYGIWNIGEDEKTKIIESGFKSIYDAQEYLDKMMQESKND